MSPWLALLPIAVSMCLGAWLSYHPTAKLSPWFPWGIAGLSVSNGFVWAWVARHAESSRQLFSLSAAFDGLTVLAYSALPLIVFNVRLSPVAWVGLAMVIVGACLVKWGG